MASKAMAGYGPPLSRTSGYDVIYLIHEVVHNLPHNCLSHMWYLHIQCSLCLRICTE